MGLSIHQLLQMTKKRKNERDYARIAMMCVIVTISVMTFIIIEGQEMTTLHTGHVEMKPIIHTFFERIDPAKRGTGMSDKADEEMLKLWEKEWQDAGWETRILSMDDAQVHPRFQEYAKKLDNIPFGGPKGKGINQVYNKLCYFRWIAMTAIGGGWMSDYDVFPAHIRSHGTLPNEGEFSVFCTPKTTHGGIPCLMSGSDKEWERVAFSIVDNGNMHQDEKLWSDMLALLDFHFSSKNDEFTYHYYNYVVPGQDVLIGKDWQQEDCSIISEEKMAVHFSHQSVNSGDITNMDGLKKSVSNRPEIVQRWLKMWRETCGVVVNTSS